MIHWLPADLQEKVLSEPEKLIELFEQSSELSADETYCLATAYEFLGQALKAKNLCREALQKNLNHFPSLYALSLKSFKERKQSEAKRYLRRALQLDADASASMIHFQKKLRVIAPLPESTLWASWALEELHKLNKSSDDSKFELGKILFEQSKIEEAAALFKGLLSNEKLAYESSQYLSYIFERLYRGEELMDHYLQLASSVKEKADLFFNLGMIFQNDRNFWLQSLHFFYLAHREDPLDPGLRFSLEQACMDHIGRSENAKTDQDFLRLMFAHLYYGSVAVAERYARNLKERWSWKFPDSFEALKPSILWQSISQDKTQVGQALDQWFGLKSSESWKIKSQD